MAGATGGFHSNRNTPAYYAFNAQFGKLLKRNREIPAIDEHRADVPSTDDTQHPTTTGPAIC